jgi:hypothetical protein
MVTLQESIDNTYHWATDRIHTLCDYDKKDIFESVEDAYAIHQEFAEWFDPNNEDDEVMTIEYMSKWD